MYPWEPQEKERLSAMKGLKKGSTRSAAAILSAALILTVGAGGCGKAEGEGGTDLENGQRVYEPYTGGARRL